MPSASSATMKRLLDGCDQTGAAELSRKARPAHCEDQRGAAKRAVARNPKASRVRFDLRRVSSALPNRTPPNRVAEKAAAAGEWISSSVAVDPSAQRALLERAEDVPVERSDMTFLAASRNRRIVAGGQQRAYAFAVHATGEFQNALFPVRMGRHEWGWYRPRRSSGQPPRCSRRRSGGLPDTRASFC
jgi:hypothetical protein